MKNTLNITIIQTQIHWENIEKNLDMFSQKVSSVKEKTDLIVLPEMFSAGFTMNVKQVAENMDGKTIQWLKRTAKEKGCVIAGSVIMEENKKYYNRLIWMRPDGKFDYYDKKHLFRYAGEQNFYAAGNKRLIVELKGWKICPLICYDLRFPVWSRNKSHSGKGDAVEMDYDALLFVANWPERRSHPWKTLLLARAMENQCYVVAVNRIGSDANNIYHSGDSAVINPKGECISKTKAHEESIETVALSYEELTAWRNTFPAGMDADDFELK